MHKPLVLFLFVSISVGCTCWATEQHQQQQQQQQQAPSSPATVAQNIPQNQLQPNTMQVAAPERQGKSISLNSNGGNNLLGSQSNIIEHSSSKSRLEQEKRQVQEFLTARNLFKSVIKLLFGSQDEVSATSRNVLGVLNKVLDLLKNTFGQKSRSGSARTIRDSAEDAASAGVSMLQGYVKSVLANDGNCAKRYLCQASRDATRDGREMGYIIASVGGYATSYLLDTSRSQMFNNFFDATTRGRSMKEDCAHLYSDCPEYN